MTASMEDLLATLLPGDRDWPSGATVAGAFAIDAGPILAALPEDFTAGDEAALQAVEARDRQAFERVVTEAYTAYYTDPAVRLVIERLAGYAARPPQPLGYLLPPFDMSVVAVQRGRAPFWRDPGEDKKA